MINSVMRRISWIFHRKSEAPASKNYEVMFLSYTQRVIHYCVAKYSNLLNITLHVALMIHSFRIFWIVRSRIQKISEAIFPRQYYLMAYKLSRLYGRSQKNHRLQRVNNVCGSFKSHTHCIRSFRMVNTHMLTGTGIERRTFASFFAITTLFYICRYPYIYILYVNDMQKHGNTCLHLNILCKLVVNDWFCIKYSDVLN